MEKTANRKLDNIQEEGRRPLGAEHVVAGAAMSSYEWWLGLEAPGREARKEVTKQEEVM